MPQRSDSGEAISCDCGGESSYAEASRSRATREEDRPGEGF